jgi:hypothetical protein
LNDEHPNPPDAARRQVILRARIGIDLPPGGDPAAIETLLCRAIVNAAEQAGGRVSKLQLAPSIDRDWAFEGPVDRSARPS